MAKMKVIDNEGCMYLGVLEMDKIKEGEMKGQFTESTRKD